MPGQVQKKKWHSLRFSGARISYTLCSPHFKMHRQSIFFLVGESRRAHAPAQPHPHFPTPEKNLLCICTGSPLLDSANFPKVTPEFAALIILRSDPSEAAECNYGGASRQVCTCCHLPRREIITGPALQGRWAL